MTTNRVNFTERQDEGGWAYNEFREEYNERNAEFVAIYGPLV